jgi:glutathionyl-hydroquinone reductase
MMRELTESSGEGARMSKREARWVRVQTLTAADKTIVSAACERFIDEKLKPRFLPEIRPTSFNYPVDIFGKWRGSKYNFVTRYRSGFADTLGEEFDNAFTRLDHVEEHIGETRFDVMWHRHTGQWWRLHTSVTLEEALHLIEAEGLLQPNL